MMRRQYEGRIIVVSILVVVSVLATGFFVLTLLGQNVPRMTLSVSKLSSSILPSSSAAAAAHRVLNLMINEDEMLSPLFPFSTVDYVGFGLAILVLMLAAGAGMGGGG
jgi:hypothetical protein